MRTVSLKTNRFFCTSAVGSKYSTETRPSIDEITNPIPFGKHLMALVWYLRFDSRFCWHTSRKYGYIFHIKMTGQTYPSYVDPRLKFFFELFQQREYFQHSPLHKHVHSEVLKLLDVADEDPKLIFLDPKILENCIFISCKTQKNILGIVT